MPSALVCQLSSGLKDLNVNTISSMETLMLDSGVMKIPTKTQVFDKSEWLQYVCVF